MATRKPSYDSEASITCSLAPAGVGLAALGARESTAVDNQTNLYVDVLVELMIKLATGSPASDKCINVWFYCSEDGTNYTDNVTGSDASVTLRSPNNLFGPFVINTPDSGQVTYKVIIPSVAKFFGGNIPPKWGIVIENRTNLALDGTEGNHTKKYKGLWETVS